jgi:pyruvate/2-oxoglutarate/acetoin dehydrogenase E1 component
MAREIPYIAAVNEAIQQEMARDETVVFYGQDVAPSDEDPLVQAFGRDRVRVSPISETAEIGMAVGLALAGYRPIVELLMAEFMLVAMNQVTNEAPRLRYMSGGQVKVPLVLKAGYGFTAGWAGQHTGSIYTMFAGVPGLKVVLPSTPADAKGLMTAAVRDDNPVVYLMHYLLVLEHGDVPEGEHVVPIGEAAIRRPGNDVTIVATGWTVGKALEAAEALAGEGIDAEVIDLRTLRPLDRQTVLRSLAKTNRMVCVEEGWPVCSISAELMAIAMEEGFDDLDAPVLRVTDEDVPLPYAANLEKMALIRSDLVVQAAKKVCYR